MKHTSRHTERWPEWLPKQWRGRGRLIGRTKGGMNTKLHYVCDSQGRPMNPFVTAGQVSDYIGARVLLGSLPNMKWPLGNRGYDANWFREAFQDKGICACWALMSCKASEAKAI
jgi:hypothetical protein